MKRVRLWHVLVPLLAIGIAAVWYVLSHGFSARTPPNPVEAFVARRLRHLAVPRKALALQNPIRASPEVLSEAMAHFADHCSVCHANDGSGKTPIGKGLYPRPPDMRLPGTQQMSDGEIYYTIRNGVRFTGMPAFVDASDDQDTDSWKLVFFIRHLNSMTSEELEEMDKMTPKSPMELQQEDEIRRFLNGDDSQSSQPAHKHH